VKLITAAVASCCASQLAFTNPTGPTVINGQTSSSQQGNLLQFTNSHNSILSWQCFSIGASEITRFFHQPASSVVLTSA
jgi:large exoprotein involved in heme utilization and adhesion